MEPKDVLISVFKSKEDLAVRLEDVRELPGYPKVFHINRMVSFFPEAVLYVNDVNLFRDLDPIMQYDYLRLTLPHRIKTYHPWLRPETTDDLENVKRYYKVSTEKAEAYLKILTGEQLQQIADSFFEGGLTDGKKKRKT